MQVSLTTERHASFTQNLRVTSVIIHRLRLGYPCWEEIQGDIRTCEYSGDPTEQPLEHYLLQCPATDRLRQLVGHSRRRAAADGGNMAEAAALVKRIVQSQDALKFCTSYPPPK